VAFTRSVIGSDGVWRLEVLRLDTEKFLKTEGSFKELFLTQPSESCAQWFRQLRDADASGLPKKMEKKDWVLHRRLSYVSKDVKTLTVLFKGMVFEDSTDDWTSLRTSAAIKYRLKGGSDGLPA
jgi:hypothetical protein